MINLSIARTPLTAALGTDLSTLTLLVRKEVLLPKNKLSSLHLRDELEEQCFASACLLWSPVLGGRGGSGGWVLLIGFMSKGGMCRVREVNGPLSCGRLDLVSRARLPRDGDGC